MKILHIGNIANNGYNNAKILNKYNIKSDVLSLNYYHIMGCPEWEDSNFFGEYKDEQLPNWSQIDNKSFMSPNWFVKGGDCFALKYLIYKNSNKEFKKRLFLKLLKLDNLLYEKRFTFFRKIKSLFLKLIEKKENISFANKEFDKLDKGFLSKFKRNKNLFEELFTYYDVVIGYGVDGIYPLLEGKNYIAFEHGTLRNLPFQNDDLGLRTFLSYKYANGVIITNADNICSAKKLKLQNYMFIPHPINESPLKLLDTRDYENLYEKYDTDFIVFHPSRQHWEKDIRHPDWEKGNDIFIEGFAKFVHNINKNAKSIFIDWGQKVNESKVLISSLGIDNNVVWIKPMHNYAMIRTILSTDLVADQFYLGAFGSTTPKALMCGKPAMLYLDESLHQWCFDEMPPVLNTATSEDVFSSLTQLYKDAEFAKDIGEKSKKWYFRYHSNELIKDKLLNMIKNVLKTNDEVVK